MGKTLLLSLCLHSLLLYAAAVTLVRDRQIFVVDLQIEAPKDQVKEEGRSVKDKVQTNQRRVRSVSSVPVMHKESQKLPVPDQVIPRAVPVMTVSTEMVTVSAPAAETMYRQGDIKSIVSSVATGDFKVGNALQVSSSGSEGKNASDPADAIRNAIERALVYPPFARKRHMEGRVLVRFSIDEKGIPSSIQVLESSGHPMLDNEALSTVARAAPLPATRVSVEIPINFRLLRAR